MGIYDIIIGRYIYPYLVLNFKVYDNVIEANDEPFISQRHPLLIWVRMNLKFKYREDYT